jgi:hypothetical protein
MFLTLHLQVLKGSGPSLRDGHAMEFRLIVEDEVEALWEHCLYERLYLALGTFVNAEVVCLPM